MPGLIEMVFISALVIGVAIVGMAIGVLVSNRRIQGSCGGLANMKDSAGKPMCMACDKPSEDCLREAEARAAEFAAQAEQQ